MHIYLYAFVHEVWPTWIVYKCGLPWNLKNRNKEKDFSSLYSYHCCRLPSIQMLLRIFCHLIREFFFSLFSNFMICDFVIVMAIFFSWYFFRFLIWGWDFTLIFVFTLPIEDLLRILKISNVYYLLIFL